MVSRLHQGTLGLFADDPWLAFDILGVPRPVSGTPIDRRAEVERAHPDRPTRVERGFPDLVLVYRDPRDETLGVVICVEAQRTLDPAKRWLLPWYQAALAKQHGLPTFVVFVSFCPRMSAAIRSWSAGLPPVVDVLLLDADTVDPVTDLQRALHRPAAAVLGAILHACRGDFEPTKIAVEACLRLEARRRDGYIDTIMAAVPESEQDKLLRRLSMQDRDTLWDIEKRSGFYVRGMRAGRKNGLREGRQEGRQEGRRETLVELIVALFDVRGIPLTDAEITRLQACTDLPTLERWAELAREAESGAALLDGPVSD